MAWYASFCLIMGPFKGEVPVFARLWPVMVRDTVSFTTGAVRSATAILVTAGLLVVSGLHVVSLSFARRWKIVSEKLSKSSKCVSCKIDNGKCSASAVCVPIPYGRICLCKDGFIGNGFTCERQYLPYFRENSGVTIGFSTPGRGGGRSNQVRPCALIACPPSKVANWSNAHSPIFGSLYHHGCAASRQPCNAMILL